VILSNFVDAAIGIPQVAVELFRRGIIKAIDILHVVFDEADLLLNMAKRIGDQYEGLNPIEIEQPIRFIEVTLQEKLIRLVCWDKDEVRELLCLVRW